MKNNFGINDIIGKYSLFNRNSESVVIGSILNNTVKIEEVLPYLKPNDFDYDINKKIFSCMGNLHAKRVSIDPIIVLDRACKR